MKQNRREEVGSDRNRQEERVRGDSWMTTEREEEMLP